MIIVFVEESFSLCVVKWDENILSNAVVLRNILLNNVRISAKLL